MSFTVPWITLTILCPLAGALWVHRTVDPDRKRQRSLICCGATLLISLIAGGLAATSGAPYLYDPIDPLLWNMGEPAFAIDAMNAPLLPLAGLISFLMVLSTLRAKFRQFSFSRMLISEAILMGILSSKHPWVLVSLLILELVPPLVELRSHRKSVNVFLLHMLLFVGLLIMGQGLVSATGPGDSIPILGVAFLLVAVLVRNGCAPAHCWIPDLFEKVSFGTALLFMTPMVGAYAAMRLVLPIAPDWALHVIALFSLFTAFYAAGMSLVQKEARRFFCFLFLSHSSLVLVGLETATVLGLTAGLCVWIAVGLSLTGFGLVLRSVEARIGQISLADYYGLYDHTPRLAALFLMTGLASIGFPGTVGFVGAELLIEGAIQLHPAIVVVIVTVAALNGLAVIQVYFRIFTGRKHPATIDLRSRMSERIAVLILTGLIIGGGLFPQWGVHSRYLAATQLMKERVARLREPAASAPETASLTLGEPSPQAVAP